MRCPICDTPTPPGAVYCETCGVNLVNLQELSDSTPPETVGNGRYRIVRMLGEGANKTVYLAHDTVLERDVALSLLKTDGFGFWRTNPTARAKMLDEARFMARLSDHPHLVSVYDVGEEGSRTFLVSQLMTGGNLEGFLEQARDHRLSLTRALAVTDQILQGLEYAHHHGIVHRDLKPGNVWLTHEGGVKIGDFGLAMGPEPAPIEVAGAIVATVAYMAPEQAAGKVPDERSDLYSVGAILYAMLSGRPPFIGDDAVAVIDQHLHAAPVTPRWFDPTIPPSVEHLVLRLLAKEPDLRPPTAHAARAALQAIAWALERGPSGGGPASYPSVDDLLSPLGHREAELFVGRRTEMERLRALADNAFRGDGRFVLVSGEAGIGKTRLAQELDTDARIRGAEVVWGRCREDRSIGFEPWVQILGSLVRWLDADQLAEAVAHRVDDLAPIVPALAERVAVTAPRPDLDAARSRWSLLDAAMGFVFAAARAQPLLLVLDDLQWADPASLRLLEFVVEGMSRVPILILGLVRSEESDHDTRVRLGYLAGHPHAVPLALHGLSEAEVERLVTLALGWEPGKPLLEALHRQTGGNPFFVAEVLRLLAAEGAITDPPKADLEALFPKTVQDLLERRLRRLSPAARALLECAAILGPHADEDILLQLLGAEVTEFDRAVDEAQAAHLLTRSVAGQVELSHALLRATLLAGLDQRQRAHLHHLAAAFLEDAHHVAGPHDRSGVAGEIAYHLAEALPEGDVVKAAAYALQAGEEAARSFSWEEAVRHFDRGRRMCDESRSCFPDLLPQLSIGLGDALVALARRAEGIAAYEHAVAVATRPSASLDARRSRMMAAEVHHKIAVAHLADRRVVESLRAFDTALSELPEHDNDRDAAEWALWSDVQLGRAEAYYHAGLGDEMGLLLDATEPLIRSFGTPRQQADLLAARTASALLRSRFHPGPEVIAAAETVLAVRRESDRRGPRSGDAHFWLGLTQLLGDRFGEARDNLEAAASAARESDDRVRETQAEVYLSLLERRLGVLHATRTRARRAEATAVRAALPGYAAAALANLAWVLLREGHAGEAREQASHALSVWRYTAPWPFEWLARFPLAAIARDDGAFDEFRAQLEAVLRPGQQALPGPLTAAIEAVLLLPPRASGHDLTRAVDTVLEQARSGNYA